MGRQSFHLWVREAWTFHVRGNHREKVLVIKRLRLREMEGQRANEGGAEVGDI